jgi:malate dehydrogenase (oxaloacetate-decarboxylating)(NADP+)
MAVTRQAALEYHSGHRPGKIEVSPTKACLTQRDLSLAYTPGVAEPCLEIKKNPHDAFRYTARGNLVAVVSNGTAVLGLGNIGALAGKPVMEGKGVLFKRFADIDVFDLEVDSTDPEEVIRVCQLLEPTFGAINLEDIRAPECFHIEETLRKTMKIPVFHDDQHGTAIITGAALLNALRLGGKDIERVRVVFNGAGAAGVACAEHYVHLGVRRENILMCDSKGVIHSDRTEGMNPYKTRFAQKTPLRSLEDALLGADVFVGLSVGGALTSEMLRGMAERPIVFGLANPDPEIPYDTAKKTRPDAIVATGRSDFPNQVNNVLGFPFIFRGALDVRATAINEEMKLAATKALANLAQEDVPDSVRRAYGLEQVHFGPDYIIPKPFDPRVLVSVASAVARAAMESGVAQEPVDIDRYRDELEGRLGKAHEVMRMMIHKAQASPRRVVFPEGDHPKILRACHILVDERIARPILLGDPEKIRKKAISVDVPLIGTEIVDPATSPARECYIEELYRLRQRRGVTLSEARELLANRVYFGAMMVHLGDADALVSGVSQHYPDTIRPALHVIKVRDGIHKVSGLYAVITKRGEVYFLADTTVNIDPDSEDLAEIALCAADAARRFDVKPRVAILSFSNFGSTKHPACEKVRRAVELVKRKDPSLMIDGEMQADTAVVPEILEGTYPFSSLRGGRETSPTSSSCGSAERRRLGRSSWASPSRCTSCSATRRWRRSSRWPPSPSWTPRRRKRHRDPIAPKRRPPRYTDEPARLRGRHPPRRHGAVAGTVRHAIRMRADAGSRRRHRPRSPELHHRWKWQGVLPPDPLRERGASLQEGRSDRPRIRLRGSAAHARSGRGDRSHQRSHLQGISLLPRRAFRCSGRRPDGWTFASAGLVSGDGRGEASPRRTSRFRPIVQRDQGRRVDASFGRRQEAS